MSKKKELSKNANKVWESYIKNPTDIYDKENDNKSNFRKERFKFDLHGYTLSGANEKVKEIILLCSENNFKEYR